MAKVLLSLLLLLLLYKTQTDAEAMCLSTQQHDLIVMLTKNSGPTSGVTPDVSATGTQRPSGRRPKNTAILR